MTIKAVQQFMLGTVMNTEAQARDTLAKMKAAGYDGIELCGFMIHPTGFLVRMMTKAAGMPVGKGGKLDWKGIVKDSGLQVVSLHTDLGSVERDAAAIAAEAKSFGTKLRNDPGFSARGLILRGKVEMIGTTDDPCDSLKWHEKLAADANFPVRVCPTFRPDKALNIRKPGFVEYVRKLEDTVGHPISNLADVKQALTDRIAYFAAHGCRAADHGLDYVCFRRMPDIGLDMGFRCAMGGGEVTMEGAEAWQTELLLHCAGEYAKRGMVMQLHYSCLRNPNSRAFAALGPDTGFDCVSLTDSGGALAKLLDELEKTDSLPKTILYSLNPVDNTFLDTLIGPFQGPGVPGKLQHGSAWWFNDNKAGMTEHLTSLANQSLLGNFIGMLTDSRSFLSYARHEYFRRILCDLLGKWAENGEYPADLDLLGGLTEDICYRNAKRYFNL